MRLLLAITITALATVVPVRADDNDDNGKNSGLFRTRLSGYEEVLPVYTEASGEMTVRVQESPAQIVVTLTYTGLTTAPMAAHLHWAQRGVSGPIILPICGSTGGNVCPANGTEATFTIPASALQAQTGQPTGFFPAGNLEALVAGLRNGVVYGNVHTQQFGGGEIRGQFGRGPQGAKKGGPPFGDPPGKSKGRPE